jgi:arylsulfatase A-like enzyme
VRRLLPLLLLAACGHAPGVPASLTAGLPAPIVLVVIDSLRADHSSLYGYARDTTPYLRALGEHAFVFDRAYATATWTRPSVASLFTSRLPESHGCEGRLGRLSPALVTLPQLLGAQGWDTRAVVADANLAPVWGFDRGWNAYRWVPARPLLPYADAASLQPVIEETLHQLRAPPFLLYLHYADPHDPYLPHPEHDWNPSYAGTFDGNEASLQPWRMRAPSPANRQRVLDLYDGEIAFVDEWLRRALAPLEAQGLLDAAWLVVTADHGEGLWDHAALGHAEEVYEPQIRVPLLIRPPGGLPAQRRLRETFSQLDLAPTLLELVGLPACADFQGRSWAPFLAGRGEAPERPIFVDEQVDDIALAAAVDGRRKVIADARSGTMLFYDLVTNPTERAELAADTRRDPSPPALQLRDQLEQALTEARARRPADNRVEPQAVPEDVRAQLGALGYPGGG